MKIVINSCYGGFGLSTKALCRLAELKGYKQTWVEKDKFGFSEIVWVVPPGEERINFDTFYESSMEERQRMNKLYSKQVICGGRGDIERDDPLLIQIVEELGEKANGMCANLNIIEIPDDVEWEISEYDGFEHIAEKHRTWE